MKPTTVCLVLVVFHLSSFEARAFDPRTHVWVGQQVLNDVVPDGKVTIDGHDYAVPDDTVKAMRQHPDIFRMANVGPDAHPDLIVGQSFLHPGTNGGWQADDWAKWIQDKAREEGSNEAIAYSAGYWGHVAGDIIAHTYVNTYAGDYFVLFDEQEVELRHFVLEHYIGDRTPPLVDHQNNKIGPYSDSLVTPSQFAARTLILNDTVADQYLKSPVFAAHLLSMWRLHKTVHDFRVAVERFEGPLANSFGELNALRQKAHLSLKQALDKILELTPTVEPLIKQVEALKLAVEAQKQLSKPIEDVASEGEKAVLRAAEELESIENEIRKNVHKLEDEVLKQIKMLERSIKKLEKSLEHWKGQVKEQTKNVKGLKKIKSDFDSAVGKLEDKVAGYLSALVPDWLEDDLNEAKDALNRAKKELQTAEENLTRATDNIDHVINEIEKATKKLKRLRDEQVNLEKLIAQLKAAKSFAEESLQKAKDTVGALSEKLQAARDAVTEKVKPWEVATEQLVQLQRALERLMLC